MKPQEKIFDKHFFERVNSRFEFPSLEYFKDNVIKYAKVYNRSNSHSCPHSVAKNKLNNPQYSHQRFYVNTRYNIAVVEENNTIFNVLYLDGRDGYGRNISWN